MSDINKPDRSKVGVEDNKALETKKTEFNEHSVSLDESSQAGRMVGNYKAIDDFLSPIGMRMLDAIYETDLSEGKQAFEKVLTHLAGSKGDILKLSMKNEYLYGLKSNTLYGKKYMELTPRQQSNLQKYGGVSKEESLVKAQRIMDQLTQLTGKTKDEVQKNLSGDYFSDSPLDFAFHLLDFKEGVERCIEHQDQDEEQSMIQCYNSYSRFRDAILTGEVSSEMRLFSHLQVLIPPEIGQLKDLEVVWIRDALVDSLPPEIEQCTKLELLVIPSGLRVSVPDALKNNPKITIKNNV
ncbi:MAG: hypothetical protein KBF71_00520 [Alphaproteobacteria bacterium]|nr:hypothetical protein [Alphaproteobacteria bacterium]